MKGRYLTRLSLGPKIATVDDLTAHADMANVHHRPTPPGLSAVTIQGYVRTHDRAGDSHDDIRTLVENIPDQHDRASILALFPPKTDDDDNRVPSQNVQQSRNLLDIGTGDALDVGELVTGTFNAD